MEVKDPKDTAMIDLNIEPAYVGKPFSTLLTNPAYPQLPGASSFFLSLNHLFYVSHCTAAKLYLSHPCQVSIGSCILKLICKPICVATDLVAGHS